jgi:hypothetical protein
MFYDAIELGTVTRDDFNRKRELYKNMLLLRKTAIQESKMRAFYYGDRRPCGLNVVDFERHAINCRMDTRGRPTEPHQYLKGQRGTCRSGNGRRPASICDGRPGYLTGARNLLMSWKVTPPKIHARAMAWASGFHFAESLVGPKAVTLAWPGLAHGLKLGHAHHYSETLGWLLL